MHILTCFAREVVAGCRLLSRTTTGLVKLTTAPVTTDALTPGTEEALHAVEATSILLSCWLCLALARLIVIVNLLTDIWVLQTSTVISKSLPVALVVRRDRLYLCLESVIDALALVDRV